MASPFKFFRKNQKVWLAFLTLLAMGGFVVLPTITQMMGERNQAAAKQDIVTTTRYGNLSRIELAGLQGQRQSVRRLMAEIDGLVRLKQQNNQGPTLAQMLATGLSADEQSVVETWLLANRADELGIVIDDTAVNAFIQQLTEGVVTQSDLAGVLETIGLPESQLFRLLGYELKAMRVQELVQSGLVPMTPGERWDYYQRLHRNMRVELAEVPVERFVASVSDPDDATLQQFFDKYKDKENIPESPEPGFMIPKRIALEYFKVDYEHLFAAGELEKYYEEHKEEFKRESLPATKPADPAPDLKGSLPGLDGAPMDISPPAPSAPAAPTAPETPTEGAKPDEAVKPLDNPPAAQPKEPKADGAKADEPKPAETTPEVTGPEPKKDAPVQPKADESPKPTDESRTTRRSPFHLTAYQAGDEKDAEEPAAAKTETPAGEAPAATQADGEKSAPAEGPAAEKTAAKEPAEPEKPAEKTSNSEAKPAESKGPETPGEPAGADPKPAQEPAAPVKTDPAGDAKTETPGALDGMPKFEAPAPAPYYTFEEVKSQIQSRLAPEKIERIFRPLENQMALYYDAHIRYLREQDDQGNSSVPRPEKPDFAKLA
ncbi:MAG: SurA N-terminal domain-containing protein, partial [Thermoguttaceae bacterium]